MKNLEIINNKNLNYSVGSILFLVLFICFYYAYVNLPIAQNANWIINMIVYILGIVLSFKIIWKSGMKVPPRKRAHLINLFGEETNVYMYAGFRLSFYLFRLDEITEMQDLERQKIEVGPFPFTDENNKKLLGFISALWVVGDADEEKKNFKSIKQEDIEKDLGTFLERSAIRIWSKKSFKKIRSEERFGLEKEETSSLKNYGVKFVDIDPVVVSGNMDQDDLNAFRDELFKKFKKEYGYKPNDKVDPKHLKEIHERIEVQLGIAKKIIGNAQPIVRYNGED